jgi:carbamoylphosphate synthase large subunit
MDDEPVTLRVLVTSAGSTAGQNLLRFLRDADGEFFVIAGDCESEHAARDLAAKNVLLPRGDDHGYAQALAKAVERTRADVVIPIMEPELAALAEATSSRSYQLGCPLMMSPPETIRTTLSKRASYRVLSDVGIGVPEQIDAAAASSFPVFVKPNAGTGSRGAQACRDRAELDVCLARTNDPVVEAVIEGEEYTLDGFADHSSKLLHFIARERTEVRSGLSTRTHIVDGARFSDEITRITEGLGLVGFFNVQCIESNGVRTYIDVNARLGGAMVLSFVGGLAADRLIRGFVSGDYSDFSPTTRVGLKLIRRWENLISEGS